MSEEQKKSETLHACPECGFHYRDEATMKKCEAWCKEHGSCSAEITALSVERTSATSAEAGAQRSNAVSLEEMEHRWKRALADYQNLQKDVARERAEMGQYATLRVVERFLPVFDNFAVAESHAPREALAKWGMSEEKKAVENWIIGIGFIQKQFAEALKDLGLTPIKTVGEKFDAGKHEAVGEEKSTVNGQLSTVITREVQPGYEINGKVIRPAKVIVNK